MIEEYENFLRCREYFRENIEWFKNAFIRYYGEERKKEIEEKFSKAIFMAYRNPDSTSHYINCISHTISDEIIDRELSSMDTSFTKKDLMEGCGFDVPNIHPIKKYKEFVKLYELGEKGREEDYKESQYNQLLSYLPELTKEEFEEMVRTQTIPEKFDRVKPWIRNNLAYSINLDNVEKRYQRYFEDALPLLQKVDPDITIENFGYYLDHKEIQNLNALAEKHSEMVEEYRARMKKYEPYQASDTEGKAIKHALETKYYIKFIEENIDLLPDSEKEGYERFKKNPNRSYEIGSYTRYIFGYGLGSNHPLEAFSSASCQKLESKEESEWKKNAIRKDRVEFFKRNGIDLGDDYDAYLESEEAKKIWPTEERANFFLETRNRLLNEFNIEYYTNTPEHQEARREIESHHFLDREDSFNASLYTNSGQTFVNPNIVETENGYDVFSLVAICCDRDTGYIDHNIIHELNHLFEMSLKSVEENQYEVICGWDVVEGQIRQESKRPLNTLKKDENKRKYELFSEIINELIAQEICAEFAKGEKHHVFDTDKNAKTKNTTSYEYTFFLVRDFFQEFKKEILESRVNGNIEAIWNRVGKENFDELNNLFHTFFSHFQGYKYYSLMQSLQNKEDNEQTRVYFDLIRKRDEVMDKMRKYSMLQEEKPKRGRKKKATGEENESNHR